MKRLHKGNKTWHIPFLCALAVLTIAAVAVRRPQALPGGFLSTPTPKITPTPAPPTPTPIPTPVPGAISILADGRLICTLSSEEDANTLLSWQLQQAEAALPEGEKLQYSAFMEQVKTREALAGEIPVTLNEAQKLLQSDASLLPSYTVSKFTDTEIIPFQTVETQDARIPYGSRIVTQVGRTGYKTTVITHTYSNGELTKEPVSEYIELEPIQERIAVGTYISGNPNADNPGRSEGQRGRAGPDGFPLSAPSTASVISNFGTRNGNMHYGLDFDSKVNDPIFAPGGGVVVFASTRGACGLVVEIDHGEGFITRLNPLSALTVRVGEPVTKGQAIGVLAPPEDEEVTPHLHMELLIDGIPYNPRQYLN